MVGIVVVSHSALIASGTVQLAAQMAGDELALEAAGGTPDGGLGTDADAVRTAIARADSGDGVAVLGDLGSAILTVREILDDGDADGTVRLLDAPLVEGAVTAALTASAGLSLDAVAEAAEGTRDIAKL